MDPWQIFSEMCRQVVEAQNVYLDVQITSQGIELMLMPLDNLEGDDE